MKPLCETCNTRHYEYQAHQFQTVASNAASNTGTASNNVRADVLPGRKDSPGGLGAERVHRRLKAHSGGVEIRAGDAAFNGGGSGGDTGADREGGAATKQRWSRESYNAYQREYMRKKRRGD
jgi:hypothetical protein